MKILVIGATGLIGSAVCARLRSDGHEVVGTARPGSVLRPAGVDRVIEIDVAADDDWYLFDPADTPDLVELTGAAFSERYAHYVAEARAGRLPRHRRLRRWTSGSRPGRRWSSGVQGV